MTVIGIDCGDIIILIHCKDIAFGATDVDRDTANYISTRHWIAYSEQHSKEYCTVGIICKILICVNYLRRCRLVDCNSTLTLIATFLSTQRLLCMSQSCAL